MGFSKVLSGEPLPNLPPVEDINQFHFNRRVVDYLRRLISKFNDENTLDFGLPAGKPGDILVCKGGTEWVLLPFPTDPCIYYLAGIRYNDGPIEMGWATWPDSLPEPTMNQCVDGHNPGDSDNGNGNGGTKFDDEPDNGNGDGGVQPGE